MKKKLAIIIAALAVAGGILLYARQDDAKAAEREKDRPATARAERGDINITVSATGRVEPEREVEIKSKASGEVIKVFADISDEVKQGMMLFKLDPTDEERSVARLSATLAMSKAKLEQMKLAVAAAEAKLEADTARAHADLKSAEAERDEYASRLRRAQQLHEQKVITREELDTAVTKGVQTESAVANARAKMDDLKVQALELERTRQEILIGEAQVENDTVSLADAEQRLKETEVFAPIDGVVSDRAIQEGFIVASGVSNVGGGTTAMKLIDVSRIYAIAAVDEADISGIKPGVKAVVTADAYKGREFTGTVVRVATTGLVESNVVTFDVKVEVDSRMKHLLKPEMTTNVVFKVDDRENVVLVPSGAVVRKAVAVEPRAANRPAPEGAPAAKPDADKPGDSRPAGEPAAPRARPERPEGEAGRSGRVDYTRRQSFVTVVKPDGSQEERRVVTGISDGYHTEIVSGLEEGETVLLQQGGDSASRWAGQATRRRPPMRM